MEILIAIITAIIFCIVFCIICSKLAKKLDDKSKSEIIISDTNILHACTDEEKNLFIYHYAQIGTRIDLSKNEILANSLYCTYGIIFNIKSNVFVGDMTNEEITHFIRLKDGTEFSRTNEAIANKNRNNKIDDNVIVFFSHNNNQYNYMFYI
jgi:hypothetical protein